jgi:hypothetical protein
MSENIWEGAEIISRYSRAQAIEDGVLVDLTNTEDANGRKLCQDAGFKWPIAMTIGAWNATIGLGGTWKPDPNDPESEVLQLPECQDAPGRIWDVLMVLKFAIKRAGSTDLIRFEVRVWDGKRQRVAKLKALCGPGDQGEPVITLMLPDED